MRGLRRSSRATVITVVLALAGTGCNQDIPPRTFHVVAVPRLAPDLRRHWHRGCWEHRHRRRPGKTRT